MAKISLRAYNREIEQLIDNGLTDEAIAHCKFILKIFPKHIDTYRLLGKAYLESERYGEASDILQRILSVIPDDFISQVGMSIIREDEGNLDAAIWHMERAFEVQPSNATIQEELRRLFSRRDGIEPAKMRLTRGALVRMYARGELFPQAITEIRSALAEDPQRTDLEVIQARMHFLLGQKEESIEVCDRLISRLPYCYEANRILTELLINSERSKEAKIHQQHLQELDPYTSFITSNAPTSAQIPDNAIMIEHLEYQPGQSDPDQPLWGDSTDFEPIYNQDVSSSIAENSSSLISESDDNSITNTTKSHENSLPPQNDNEDIPEWMRNAGWTESNGEPLSGQIPHEQSDEDSSILEEAEIPDWLAQDNTIQDTSLDNHNKDESENDWLDNIISEPPTSESEQNSAGKINLDNSFETIGFEPIDEEASTTTAKPTTTDDEQITEDVNSEINDLPDWLQETEEEFQFEPQDTTEDVSKWLETQEVEPMGIAQDNNDENPLLNNQESKADQTQPTKSYSKEDDQPSIGPSEDKTPEDISGLDADANEMDNDLAWLETLAARQGADQDTLITSPEDRSDTPPEWIKDEFSETADLYEDFEEQEENESSNELDLSELLLENNDTLSSDDEKINDELLSSQDEELSIPDWIEEVEENIGDERASNDFESIFDNDLEEDKLEITPQQEQQTSEQTPSSISHEEDDASLSSLFATNEEGEDSDIPEWVQNLSVSEDIDESANAIFDDDDAEIPAWISGIEPDTSDEENEYLEELLKTEDTSPPEEPEKDFPPIEQEDKLTPEELETLLQLEEQVISTSTNEYDPQSDIDKLINGKEETEELDSSIPPTTHVEPDEELTPEEIAQLQELEDQVIKTGTGEYDPQSSIDKYFSSSDEDEKVKEKPQTPSDEDELTPEELETLMEMEQTLAASSAKPQDHQSEIDKLFDEQDDDTPDWLKEIDSQIASDSSSMAPPQDEIDRLIETTRSGQDIEPIPDQLPTITSIDEHDIQQIQQDVQIEITPTARENKDQYVSLSEKAIELDDTLPDWISDDYQPQKISQSPTMEEVSDFEEDALPSWILDEERQPAVTEISESQTETSLPPIPHSFENQDIPEWLQEFSPEETKEIQTFGQLSTLPIDEIEPKPVTIEEISDGILSDTPQELLKQARLSLIEGDLNTALNNYNQLIQGNQFIEETIQDIQNSLYRFPVEPSIWQFLGDAYARNNQLQEALEAYTKAEELIL